MNRTLAMLAVAGLAVSSFRARSQDLPEGLKGEALEVRVHALVPAQDRAQNSKASWEEASVKYTVPGVPVGVKLLGTNLVIMTQVTPFDKGGGFLTLVAQGQIWVRSARGLSYRTTLETVDVAYDETVFFYPLGIDTEGKAPLRIEITVSRRGVDKPGVPSAEPAGSPKLPISPPPSQALHAAPDGPQPTPGPEPNAIETKPKK